MKNLAILCVVVLFSIFFSMQSVQACSITAGGFCAGSPCPKGEKCKKVSDYECKCVKEKGVGAGAMQQTQTEEMQQKQADEELQRLLRLECVFYGGVNNQDKTLTLVNRCNTCMSATIYWTKWQGGSFTRTYQVAPLNTRKIKLEGESSSLIAENPCTLGSSSDEGEKGTAIKQGCCYKKKNSTCMCSAPVLKKDCPSDYTWKEGKNCYEPDKTGCCD
jgi:hypothetical protein